MGLIRDYSDQQIIAALQSDREMDDAISFIYRNYYGLLQQYVLNNKGTKDDAADIIQETIVAFIEIVQQNKFRGESSVKSFLYSITRNLWLSELRRKNSADNRNRNFEQGKEVLEETVVQHLIGREHYRVI